jgi:hypothetical protein
MTSKIIVYFKSHLNRIGPISLLGVLFIGIITNTIYDLVIKPSLLDLGNFTLRLITLGSAKVQDSIYISAALDPTATTSLKLYFWVVLLALIPMFYWINKITSQSQKIQKNSSELIEEIGAENIKEKIKSLERTLFKLQIFGLILGFVFFITTLTSFLVQSQAVNIWRTFNANLTILSPFLSAEKLIKFKADFCSMQNKNDFVTLKNKIQTEAKTLKIEIHSMD